MLDAQSFAWAERLKREIKKVEQNEIADIVHVQDQRGEVIWPTNVDPFGHGENAIWEDGYLRGIQFAFRHVKTQIDSAVARAGDTSHEPPGVV